MNIHGLVVSERDGNVNWEEMRDKGIEFAMLCAGYGSGSIDLQFRKNAESCTKLGIPFGVYWLSYAYTVEKAEQEALRREYLAAIRANLTAQLDGTVIQYPDGTRKRLKKKKT